MSSRFWLIPALLALVSVLTLATALVSQHVFGLEPCQLCLWQRWPYVATAVLGTLGAVFAGMPMLRHGFVALAGAAFLIGTGIAGFHAGVEYGWWEGLPGCAAPAIEKGMSIEEVQRILEARTRVVPCDEPAWSLFGISMAGYNFLLSLALTAITVWALATRRA